MRASSRRICEYFSFSWQLRFLRRSEVHKYLGSETSFVCKGYFIVFKKYSDLQEELNDLKRKLKVFYTAVNVSWLTSLWTKILYGGQTLLCIQMLASVQHPDELGPSVQRKQQLSDGYWDFPEKCCSMLLKIRL